MTTNKNIWKGRVDDNSDLKSYRWHQCVKDNTNINGLSLLGFSCDIGVERNHGRTGAKQAPDIIKSVMSNLPANSSLQQHIFDAGNITARSNDLEIAQQQLAKKISELLSHSGRLLVLGGGHEAAWGSFIGLAQHAESQKTLPRIGIINFDAHFDLRNYENGASSGSPFLQIKDYCVARNRKFNYACLGVSETSNTARLFETANQLNVWYCYDSEMTQATLPRLKAQLSDYIEQFDWLYLTIDLDVLPPAVAPGVSAPATLGVELSVIEPLIKLIVDSGKLTLADIVECNPNYDIDNRTARVAARLGYWISC